MPRSPRFLTIVLFAMALALRAWVPGGWMPTPGAHDFSIMPCPAANAAPMKMMHGSRDQDHSGAGDCFSPLMAGLALPEPPPTIAAPSPPPATALVSLAPAAFARALPLPRPFSTGPPELA